MVIPVPVLRKVVLVAQQVVIPALVPWAVLLAAQQVVIPVPVLRKVVLVAQQVVIPALVPRAVLLAAQQAAILAQVLQVVQLAVIPVLVIRGVRYLLLLHLVERVPGPVTVMVKVL
ncbi:hypothetical protein ACRWZQ_26830, partial [Escherichia coli]